MESETEGESPDEEKIMLTRRKQYRSGGPTHQNPLPALETSEFLQPLLKLFEYSEIIKLREVSKSWNTEACLILKELSFVHLCGKSEEDIDEINALLDFSIENNLSTPFKYFFVYVKEIPSESISRLLAHDIALIGLNYHTDGSQVKSGQEAKIIFRDFLKEFGSEISQIIYVYDKSTNEEETQTQDENDSEENSSLDFHVQLHSLKIFEYWERHINSSPEDVTFLMEMILNSPNLHKFVTNTRYTSIYEKLLEYGSIYDKLEDLHVIDCPVPMLSRIFRSMHRPKLQSLAIQVWSNTSTRLNTTILQEILIKISSTIEELSISYIDLDIGAVQALPTCPKLESLLLDNWTGVVLSLLTEKMPNLRNVFISDYGFEIDNLDTFRIQPHSGVEHFALRGVGLKSRRAIDIYMAYMDYISLQFPNINSFAFTMDYVAVRLILSLFRTFPQVETLEIQAWYTGAEPEVRFENTESVFTGHNHYTMARLENSPELARIKAGPSILDLTNLKSLIIKQNGLGEMISENGIKHGISRISTLQKFTCDMCPVISSELIHQNLSNLDKIVLTMDSKVLEESYDEETVSNFEEIIADLKGLLPQLVINYRSADPLDKFDFRNY